MRTGYFLCGIGIAGFLTVIEGPPANATEYGFSTYGLGGAAFGAGVTPPPGIYVTTVTSHYQADIGGQINFGGVVINAGAEVEAFSNAWNILYVPQRKLFGGSIGLAVTIPSGHVDIDATVGIVPGPTISAQADGWGLGDIVTRAQLGWTRGGFSHLVYVQAVAPTGKWDPGFSPIIGLHRPGIDIGWAYTWEHKPTKLQFNGALGITFNFENTATNYTSGNEFHYEWAVGREVATGLVVGIVGYDYRQITGDSGGLLGRPLKGEVDAIGAGLSYTTLIDKTPLIINMRHYHEYSAENRWKGDSTILSGTVRW